MKRAVWLDQALGVMISPLRAGHRKSQTGQRAAAVDQDRAGGTIAAARWRERRAGSLR
jgi:hypothetical protein